MPPTEHRPSLDDLSTVLTAVDFPIVVEEAERRAALGATDALRRKLEVLAVRVRERGGSDWKALAERIARMLEAIPKPLVEPGEPFADAALAALGAMSASERAAWAALFQHAESATTAKPSAKWIKQARALVDAIGDEAATAALEAWLGRVEKPKELRREGQYAWQYDPPICERNADILRGLVWTASTLCDSARAAAMLGDLGAVCFQKIPNYGAVSTKVGNACLWSLGAMRGTHGVAQLGRLKTRVRYASALKLVDKALASAAARAGVTQEELEDMSVPSCGFDADGVLEERFGDFTARATLGPKGDVELVWVDERGKAQSSVPAAVKRDHADGLKELRAAIKDATTLYPAQVTRLERALVSPREWSTDVLRARFLDHPLVGRAARRLVWLVGDGASWTPASWVEGALVNREGREVTGGRARLWHPLGRAPEEVLAWRRRLAELGVTQPFKQAHREIYVLTDAELATRTYSNRFAGHVLRQHQLAALLRERGWRYTLQGQWDSANTPSKAIADAGLVAQLFVEAAWETEQTSEAGIFLHVSTDQVRFLAAAHQPVALVDVPPLVFSEIMRDVDLFVGVCSVGNDPTWVDQGPQEGRDYWHDFAFGELGVSARTRKEVLESLVPKLKIRDRCTFDGRYLVVRGNLRTYKIHLGSGNILMEPNDQYLCIVPDRRASKVPPGLVLPFEGDPVLGVVLSKAILLAADDRITDESIVRQIRG